MRGISSPGLSAVMGAALIGAGLIASVGSARAGSTSEFTVGNWSGYSYTDDKNRFTDCAAWTANQDNLNLGVDVTSEWKLQLWLYRKDWHLPQDTDYPVSYWVDRNQVHSGRVKFYNDENAFIDVDDGNGVFEELKAGSQVTIRTYKYDYIFDLGGSRAALGKLIDCVDRNAKATDSNPFGPDNGGQQSQQPDVPQTGQQASQQGEGGNDLLSNPTMSVDEVKNFIVEVTGAKPSMITATAEKDKSGGQYYTFKTPLGEGQFWQRKVGSASLQEMADSYVAKYKEDCKSGFEDNPNKPVDGDHGHLASGTAACAQSPYQKDGPEFISYSIVENDGVLSYYLTYTGGNAAKAKSDSLGRLIEKRYEDLVK